MVVGKEQAVIECITEFEAFLDNICFDLIQPAEDNDYFHPILGRISPHFIYIMDQVPLQFLNVRDEIFTMYDKNDANIKLPKESLCKYRFNMHIVFDSGTG